jgi:molybdopterin converting factor small subunit
VITIELPRALGVQVNGDNAVRLESGDMTVKDALAELGRISPPALDRLMNERGEVRQHVNLFVDDENIRFLEGLDSRLTDGSTLFVLAAISGG